jgi:prepilin-type N-terminal cleavage/methylation domain-containing protein
MQSIGRSNFFGLLARRIGVVKNQRGFTLLELLIVILVIGIVAAIMVPVFRNLEDTSRPSELDVLTQTVVQAVSGRNVDVETLLHVNDHLRGISSDEFRDKLKAAGISDRQLEVIRTGKFRVIIE